MYFKTSLTTLLTIGRHKDTRVNLKEHYIDDNVEI
jgi:hypothetical protein